MKKLSKREIKGLKCCYKNSIEYGFFKGTFEEYLKEISEEDLKELLLEINED